MSPPWNPDTTPNPWRCPGHETTNPWQRHGTTPPPPTQGGAQGMRPLTHGNAVGPWHRHGTTPPPKKNAHSLSGAGVKPSGI